jgi:tRNA(Ile)-lysidine synthase
MGDLNVNYAMFISLLDEIAADETSHVLAAVSGGPDSMLLMRWLHQLERLAGVVHINHQLRGDDSEADAEFVKEQCAKLDVPCHVVVAPVFSEPGNLENNARDARYRAFEEIATKMNVKYAATGHTSDDQTETILHRLIRGTGLAGVSGIPTSRDLNSITIIRPLLMTERHVVLSELENLQQTYRIDSSNSDPRFTRNRVRHELLPLLRTFNPKVDRAIQNVAWQAHQYSKHLEHVVEALLQEVELPRSLHVVVLSLEKLKLIEQSKLGYIQQLIWEREHWPMGEMSIRHWVMLTFYVRGGKEPFDLPGKIRIEPRGNVVLIGPRAAILGR